MLNNKADFILEYNERSTHNLKRDDVDWSQSRVIFVAPEFTKYQQHAIGFKDLAIQLYELHRYKNGLLVFNEIKPSDRRESIISVAKGNLLAKKVSEEIKVYTEDDLLNAVDDEVKELYSQLKSDVIMLGRDIEVRPTKKYIAFRRRQGFLGIVLLKSKLKAYLNIELSELRDPLNRARDVKNIGHYPPGDTELTITKKDEIPYALDLVKQAYEKRLHYSFEPVCS
jgi:predicted transport protein